MKRLLSIVLAVFVFAYSQVVFAGAIGPWVGNLSPGGALVYYSSKAYSKAQQQMGIGKRWNPDVLASTHGGVQVAQNVALDVGAGVAKTTLLGTISPSAVVGVAGAILGGPVGAALTALAIVPAVVDWLLLADARPSVIPGTLPYEIKQAGCIATSCTQYRMTTLDGWASSYDAACAAYVARLGGLNANPTAIQISGVWTCKYTYNAAGTAWAQRDGFLLQSVSQTGQLWNAANWSDFSQKLSGVSVSTALINSLLDAGYTFPLDGMSVTGPSTVIAPPVSSTSTTINTNGDTITTTNTSNTTSNQTYGTGTDPATGQTVPTVTSATTTTTTTNVYNNTTNSDVSNTTSSVNKVDTPPVEEKDPCKENPDSLGCAKMDTPDGDIPKASKNITYTVQNPFGGGSCPADKYQTLHTGQTLKVVDWATPCGYIASYVRPVLILLGSWMAMMLLIPGRTES